MDWTDEERAIFGPYWNGQFTSDGQPVNVYGDPGRIDRLIIQGFGGHYHEARRDFVADMICEGDEWVVNPDATPEQRALAMKAQEAYAAVAVSAFGLTPFDPATGKGCTEAYGVGLMILFGDWKAELKKKESPPPASAPSTASGLPAGGLGTPTS